MFRVLDLTAGSAGAFATMILGSLGGEIVRVPPATQAGWETMNEDAVIYLSRWKTQVQDGGRDLLDLAAGCDAVVEDEFAHQAERRITFDALQRRNPAAVLTSITPFGLEGPRASWKASELVLQAMGGLVFASGNLDGPPRRLAGMQASHVAGLHAAVLTLAALFHIAEEGQSGVHIDVSVQEVMSTHWAREIGRYVYTGEDTGRQSEELGLQGFPHTAAARDGHVFLLARNAEWEAFAHFLGLDQYLGPPWNDTEYRVDHWEEIAPHFEEALRRKGRYEWFSEASAEGWTFAPVDDPFTLLESPQLRARRFLEQLPGDDGSIHLLPGPPFRFE